MNELVFDVTQESDGGFVAECLNVKEATHAYFFDKLIPSTIRLHMVRDELMAFA